MHASRIAFRELLAISLSESYTAELTASTESPAASRRHYKRMGRILSLPLSAKGRPVSRRRSAVIALLVAAAILLLAGCGAILREALLPDTFSQTAFRSYDRGACIFVRDPNYKTELSTCYLPTLPKDYAVLEKQSADYIQVWEWANKRGDTLYYHQYALSQEFRSISVADYSILKDFTQNGIVYFYQESKTEQFIFWTYEGYGFSLTYRPRFEVDSSFTAEDLFDIAKSTLDNEI